jgi:hypothetical protein
MERNLKGPQHIIITKELLCRRPIDPDIHVSSAAGSRLWLRLPQH